VRREVGLRTSDYGATGGVEINPSRSVEQEKINKILAHVESREKDLNCLLEVHK
jgi:hypothetical protein